MLCHSNQFVVFVMSEVSPTSGWLFVAWLGWVFDSMDGTLFSLFKILR